jgi:putative MFS transporter
MTQTTTRTLTPEIVNVDARLDAMPRVPLGLAGATGLMLTYFFANYDIAVFAIVVPSLLTHLGLQMTDLGVPIFWNLAGYAIGAYLFGYVADRFGRQKGLALTIIVLAAGGFLSGFAWDLWSFTIARLIAGAGMGAVLGLGAAYVGELAPAALRGKYLAKLFTVQGALLVIIGFVSLWALEAYDFGWRLLLAFGGLVIFVLPFINNRAMVESPRWLVSAGKLDRADRIMTQLETRGWAGQVPPVIDSPVTGQGEEVASEKERSNPIRALMQRPYAARMAIILVFWIVYYLAAYGFLSYTTLILEGLGTSAEDSLLVTVVGRLSGIIVPLIMIVLIERMERRTLIIQGTMMVAAGLLILLLPFGPVGASVGLLLVNLGIGWTVMPAYIYTAEIFPTQARGTAASIADGVGHLGGGAAPFLILPILATAGAVPAVWVLIAATVGAGLTLLFGPRTKGKTLSEI